MMLLLLCIQTHFMPIKPFEIKLTERKIEKGERDIERDIDLENERDRDRLRGKHGNQAVSCLAAWLPASPRRGGTSSLLPPKL